LLPAAFNTESQPASFIRARIAKGTVVDTDGITFMSLFRSKRINHQEAYRLDGARANMAEEYLTRPRRAEIGTHRHFARRLSPCAHSSQRCRRIARSIKFWNVSNIDQPHRELEEHADSITAPARRLPVTESFLRSRLILGGMQWPILNRPPKYHRSQLRAIHVRNAKAQ
jgi:hypothetical protein